MKRKKSLRLRLAVMLGVLAVVATGYFTAVGIGNLCGIGFGSITLICPLGALLVMLSERILIPLAVLSIAAAFVICLLLGKVFCAWGCPVSFLSRGSKKRCGEGTAPACSSVPTPQAAAQTAAQTAASAATSASPACPSAPTPQTAAQVTPARSLFRRLRARLRLDGRHGILAAALISTLIFGFPVFCLVCPVGLTFASVLLLMRLFVFGETTWTLLVFPLIIAAEVFLLPRWCHNFCPLGALLSLFSRANVLFRPHVNAKLCLRGSRDTSCDLCERACPEDISLHEPATARKLNDAASPCKPHDAASPCKSCEPPTPRRLNDCRKCRACADACPTNAITFPFLPPAKPAACPTQESE